MVDLWVLHINLLKQTFDQSLMKIFQRVQEIWSGQEVLMKDRPTNGRGERTDEWTDRGTDEDYFYNPLSDSQRGINKENLVSWLFLIYCFSNIL